MTKMAKAIDAHVGRRVRLRRKLLGLTQTVLADRVGITFQQVQKYENGTNRIGASRLYEIAAALDVPVSFFFDDLPAELGRQRGASDGEVTAMLDRADTLALARAFSRIEDVQLRRRICDLVASMAGHPAPA